MITHLAWYSYCIYPASIVYYTWVIFLFSPAVSVSPPLSFLSFPWYIIVIWNGKETGSNIFFLQKKTDLFESLLAACFPLTGHHASTSLCALWQLHCSRCWLLLWCACIMRKKYLESRILSLMGAWKMKMWNYIISFFYTLSSKRGSPRGLKLIIYQNRIS